MFNSIVSTVNYIHLILPATLYEFNYSYFTSEKTETHSHEVAIQVLTIDKNSSSPSDKQKH